MKVLFWGIILFCCAFFVHLIVWRIRLPKRQTKTLLVIFFGTLLIGLFTLGSAKFILPEYLHIVLFVTSLTLAYMITYSALEADSPSLVMIMSIANAGITGLLKTQFEQRMTDDVLIIPRIQDLLRDQMIYEQEGKYKLTSKGLLFARIFIVYRHILNISQKGG
jgi:hypothetical protein